MGVLPRLLRSGLPRRLPRRRAVLARQGPELIAGSRVWVTGASSGIGAALARELQARGAHVAISARGESSLAAVGTGMHIEPLDVTDGAAVLAAASRVRAALGGLDTVVLNAGTWTQVDVDRWDPAVFARHLDVNVMGMVHGIGAVLPEMLARGAGTIVGVASVAGYRGIPGGEAYGTTKAAQIALLESLRVDVARRGVRVQTVCPGFVRTPMTEANTFLMPFIISADDAAREIADGMGSGRAEIVFPRRMMLAMKLARLVPVGLWARGYSRLLARSQH